jgi:uncharacterized membrane protein
LREKFKNEFTLIVFLTVLLIIIISAVPSNPLRIVLGLPFILFFPGYTLMAALFPKKTDLGNVERVALSFGLSIAIVPLLGLILNYAWTIDLYPILISVSVFIVIASIVSWYRRQKSPPEERLSIRFHLNRSLWTGMQGWDRTLSIILAASILVAIGTIAYVIITPKIGEKYTEFYILGLEGEAKGYPTELTLGEEGRLLLGIVNREHDDSLTYRVEILVKDREDDKIGPLSLGHDERWEQEVSFVPWEAGDDQKVEFLLYKDGDDEPYSSIHIWVDVRDLT